MGNRSRAHASRQWHRHGATKWDIRNRLSQGSVTTQTPPTRRASTNAVLNDRVHLRRADPPDRQTMRRRVSQTSRAIRFGTSPAPTTRVNVVLGLRRRQQATPRPARGPFRKKKKPTLPLGPKRRTIISPQETMRQSPHAVATHRQRSPWESDWTLTRSLGSIRDLGHYDEAPINPASDEHFTYSRFRRSPPAANNRVEFRLLYTATGIRRRHRPILLRRPAGTIQNAGGSSISKDPIGFAAGDANL